MGVSHYRYVIVGAGLAGASAIEGIRELDQQGSILIIGKENHLPYHRPPLTKKLWEGKKQVDEIFVQSENHYAGQKVALALGTSAISLNPSAKTVDADHGVTYSFDKLLIATGVTPRRLTIPGSDLENVCYFRTLDDYLWTRRHALPGRSALVVGGGFIGSEAAAALAANQVYVSMLFPNEHISQEVFPESLAKALEAKYAARGVRIIAGDTPTSFIRHNGKILASTKNGEQILCDFVIVGVGVKPAVELAQSAGLSVGNGILVNSYLQTSNPDIFAAGDNAFFPCPALEQSTRIEHWDNAANQGKLAGRNMAGAEEPYLYLPYFFSDLFEFGYEAIGEVRSKLDIVSNWQKENERGVLCYLRDGRVRGLMMCNVWNQVDAARTIVTEHRLLAPQGLKEQQIEMPFDARNLT